MVESALHKSVHRTVRKATRAAFAPKLVGARPPWLIRGTAKAMIESALSPPGSRFKFTSVWLDHLTNGRQGLWEFSGVGTRRAFIKPGGSRLGGRVYKVAGTFDAVFGKFLNLTQNLLYRARG